MVSTIINEKKRSREVEKSYKERKTSRYERKINKAKLKSREELDIFDWNKWKFSEKDFWIDPYVDTIDRIDCRKVSKQEFIDRYEKPNVPVVITHGTDDWKANEYWNEKYFLEKYGKELYKVGEDDDGNNVYMKMKHFLYYCQHDAMTDDSPLYIFDSGFYKDRKKKKSNNSKKSKSSSSSDDNDENDHQCNNNNTIKKQKLNPITSTTSLLNDYQVPHYFDDDLFQLTGSRRRPPYRWLVVGPARSGTGIHTDPLGTSAWNALLKGHKRWALFPPGAPKKIIDPPMKPYDHEGVSWFSQVFPKFKKRDDPNDIRTLGERLGMIEVLQRPGETIFVPGGWDHVVMNLDMTIAVTQNYCSPTNLEYVYLSTRNSRPKLGAKLLRQIHKLGVNHPDSIYSLLSTQLDSLKYTPQIPPSSSSDSDSSTSSSSSSSSGTSSSSFIIISSKDNKNQLTKKKKIMVSSTDSETDLSDGTCMCQKCKLKRKKKEKLKNINNSNITTPTITTTN